MAWKKLLHSVVAGALLAGVAAVSGAVMNLAGSVANQECLKNGCAGTLTSFTGILLVNADANDIGVSVFTGDTIGSVTGTFNMSTWGDFQVRTKGGTAASPTYSGAAVLVLESSGVTVPIACSGAYRARFGSQAVLFSDFWGDMGFSLSGSYLCFQDQSRTLVLDVNSPQLGRLAPFTGSSVNDVLDDSNQPIIGLAFNGMGLLSLKSNNIEGLRARLSGNYGQDAFSYGSQALVAIGTTVTKYDFNVDVRRNVQDVTEYLTPWTKSWLPSVMGGWGGWGAGVVSANGLKLSSVTPAYNMDVNAASGAAAKNGTIWFNLESDSCGAGINGNAGCTIKIDGAEAQTFPGDPTGLSVTKTMVSGKKTVIVEGGNLYVNSDMYYENPSDMVVFVVRRSKTDPRKGGNVYVDPKVTNMVGSFIIDGAFMNYDGTSVVAQGDGSNAPDLLALRRQLLLYGAVASSNSIGGSARGTSGLCPASGIACTCPYGTDWEKQNGTTDCTAVEASKYDFAALRSFATRQSLLAPSQTDTPGPTGTYACDTDGSPGTEMMVPVATDAPIYDERQYAWAGKRRCYQTDTAVVDPTRAGVTTDKTNPMVIEFNKAVTSANMQILRKNEN